MVKLLNALYFMRFLLSVVVFMLIKIDLNAQSFISVPGDYYQIVKGFPLSNKYISFNVSSPFIDEKRYYFDENNSYQFLISLPIVGDSLLSECIKYAMFSLSFELLYKKQGVEIWYGLINNRLNEDPTVTGLYYKNFNDSTWVYVLTTYGLSYIEKKKKTNTSKYICETIKNIFDRYRGNK